MPALRRLSKLSLYIVVLALIPAGICRAQEKAAAAYPNSADGLRQRLSDLLVTAKTMDQTALAALLKNEMEIPNFPAWFNKTYGKSDGKDFAEGYRMNVDYDEFRFAGLLKQLAQSEATIGARKINDQVELGDAAEIAKLHSMKKRADIYFASWRAPADPIAEGGPIGYFMFIEGAFRWDNAGSRQFLPTFFGSSRSQVSPTAPDLNGPYQPGRDGVGYPSCARCPDPSYTPKARAAHIEGTVELWIVIPPTGVPEDIRVVTSLGYGLDEAAIAAVRKWQFNPALDENGNAVPVYMTIECAFRANR